VTAASGDVIDLSNATITLTADSDVTIDGSKSYFFERIRAGKEIFCLLGVWLAPVENHRKGTILPRV
jgi:hypothetical protein